MKCPFGDKPEERCNSSKCVFASRVNKTRCFYGERIDVSNVAFHKGLTVKQVKMHLSEIEEQVHYAIKLFKYAEFCSDEAPSKRDMKMFSKLQDTKPYNTQLFSFVTLQRFARMNRAEAFEAFKRTGVVIEESLKEFLTKPLNLQER